jgi:ABC-type Mn2+/Zn2+ transport system permease subunit
MVGWVFGALVSLVGMLGSALLDLPTGATVVCVFGLLLMLFWGIARIPRRQPVAQ